MPDLHTYLWMTEYVYKVPEPQTYLIDCKLIKVEIGHLMLNYSLQIANIYTRIRLIHYLRRY